MHIIGIDIGATYIKSGIVDDKGKIKNFLKSKNRSSQGEDFLISQIVNIITDYKESANIKKAGLGFAGQVNHRKGLVISGANMPNCKDLYLQKTLERKCDIKIAIDNDAHCFGLAEMAFGAGKNYKNIICLTLGTGIGGAIIINKKLYRGKNNTAGEFGHMTIDASSEIICGCGNYGHFEALAGGRALSNLYKSLTDQEAESDLIIDMAAKGEKIAQKALIQTGYNFSIGLAGIINIFNPEIVIIGGGLVNVDLLWKTALNNYSNFLIHKNLLNTKIVKSKLGDKAGILGAALLF